MSIKKNIKEIENKINKGNINEALVSLLESIDIYPNNIQLRNLLGNLYFKLGELDNGLSQFNYSLNINFDKNLAEFVLDICLKEKKWSQARIPLDLLIASSKRFDLLLIKARILREQGLINDAKKIYADLLEKGCKDLSLFISYGYTLNRQGLFTEAVQIYGQGLLIHKEDPDLHFNIGITYGNLKEYDKAIKYLGKESNKQKPISQLLTLANFQHKIRNFDDAEITINEAYEREPENPLVIFQKATLKMQSGNNKEALKLLQQALTKNPNDNEINYHIGIIKLRLGQIQESIKYYDYRMLREKDKLDVEYLIAPDKLNVNDELLVMHEQGVGDQILATRILDKLSEKVKKIMYLSTEKLYPYLKRNLKKVEVLNEVNFLKKNYPNHSLKINLLSCLKYINNPVEISRRMDNYRIDDLIKNEYLKKYKNDRKKIVGLSWFSKNEKIGDEKSYPLEIIKSLNISDSKFISLQYGDVKKDINKLKHENSIEIINDDELDYYNDIDKLSCLVSICDIVITCSNVTAHISGSLGIKTFLVLPKLYGKIWYWYHNADKYVWYPSVKIIEQDVDNDWHSCILKINQLLKD